MDVAKLLKPFLAVPWESDTFGPSRFIGDPAQGFLQVQHSIEKVCSEASAEESAAQCNMRSKLYSTVRRIVAVRMNGEGKPSIWLLEGESRTVRCG